MSRAALTDDSPAASRPASRSGRFASEAVRAVLRRRMMEMFGLLVAILAIGLGVALGSHNPADPSLNTATSGPTTNLAGPAGAILSDIMLQGFGFANFTELMAAARDGANGVILDLASVDSVQLAGVASSALGADDFVFLA